MIKYTFGWIVGVVIAFTILFFVDRWVTDLTGYSPLKRRK